METLLQDPCCAAGLAVLSLGALVLLAGRLLGSLASRSRSRVMTDAAPVVEPSQERSQR